MINKLVNRVLSVLRSRRFYRFIIGFFIFEAGWIAITAAYPQAFDENFHFGLIKVYSHHILPFLSGQPQGANAYGAVARDPSYLYHYLMSFPYRLIALVFKRQAYQVIALRFINIALFAYGLTLFKQILKRTKVSNSLSNLVLLLFTLIPIVPQLAGQINYDNMLFPLTALAFLLCFKLIDEIKDKKPTFKTSITLIILCIFTSLVKYAFLPIFLGIILFFAYLLIKSYHHKLPALLSVLKKDFSRQSPKLKILLIGLLIVASGMFIQRDGINLIKYHAIAPDCAKVLNTKDCSAYSVWNSDNNRHQSVISDKTSASRNIIYYGLQWIYWMWYRLFFAINGPNASFTNYPPLPLPSAVAALIAIVGVVAVIKYRRKLFRSNPYALFISIAIFFYVGALIIQGYSTYQFTAVLENMNGRYLLPILLLVVALFGQAFSIALKKSSATKVVLACGVVILFLQGGGLLTFISRSDQSWDWHNSKIITINNAARHITSPIVIDGRRTYPTRLWFFN
jgi:hypothetical protein